MPRTYTVFETLHSAHLFHSLLQNTPRR